MNQANKPRMISSCKLLCLVCVCNRQTVFMQKVSWLQRQGSSDARCSYPCRAGGTCFGDFGCSDSCGCLIVEVLPDRGGQFLALRLCGAYCTLTVASSVGNKIYQKVIWVTRVGFLLVKSPQSGLLLLCYSLIWYREY